MDKFLGAYSLPRLSQKETDNLNRLITRSEIEFVIKKNILTANKSPGPNSFTWEFYQTYKVELIPIFLKLFQKSEEERTLLNPSYKATITLTKTRKRYYKKIKLKANIFDEYRCKNHQQNISKLNQKIYKKDHTPWSSLIYSRVTRMVQHWQINQCDTTH